MTTKRKTPIQISIFVLLAAFVLFADDASAQKRKKPRIKHITATVTVSASKPTPAQRRQEAFETAWATINEFYYDKTFGGLDWNKVRAEFLPRVAAAKTDAAFHKLLEEMLARFEEGVALVRRCNAFLKQAQARVEQYVEHKDGHWVLRELD